MYKLSLCLLISITSSIVGVPPDYCLSPLNDSDCQSPPVPVFSYYKPGSRCEIYLWRGCPTLNKFPNQYECNQVCISRLWGTESSGHRANGITFDTPQYCLEPLNSATCSPSVESVYTYDHIEGRCKWNMWYGCQTRNKFSDEATCHSACTGKVLKALHGGLILSEGNNLSDWMNKLDGSPNYVVEEVDDLLNTIKGTNDKTPDSVPPGEGVLSMPEFTTEDYYIDWEESGKYANYKVVGTVPHIEVLG